MGKYEISLRDVEHVVVEADSREEAKESARQQSMMMTPKVIDIYEMAEWAE